MTDRERKVVARLLSRDFPGRQELVAQSAIARVRQIDPEGSLAFETEGPIASVGSRVPVEARFFDGPSGEAGPRVNLPLHVVAGMLHELEIYKDDGSEIAVSPFDIDPERMDVVSIGVDESGPYREL